MFEEPKDKTSRKIGGITYIYRRYTRKQIRYNACGMKNLQVSWNYKDQILTNI